MAKRRAIRKPYVFTPARRHALAKAREIRSQKAASQRKGKAASRRRIYSSNPTARGVGVVGARKNFIPYVRANQHSQTAGFNVGTIIPGTGRRVVTGGYIRLEKTSRGGPITDALNATVPKNSLAGKARRYFNENVTVTNPAVRAKVPGGEARLATSRRGGATVTYRRGRHKVPQKLSKKGVKEYDLRTAKAYRKQMKTTVRPQRRNTGHAVPG